MESRAGREANCQRFQQLGARIGPLRRPQIEQQLPPAGRVPPTDAAKRAGAFLARAACELLFGIDVSREVPVGVECC